jgi:type IV secretory pathway VirB2 component (pilin)
MAEETTVTTGEAGTSATAEGAGVTISTEGLPKSIREMLLYKIDRTLAVVGIIALGAWALKVGTNEAIQIAAAAVGFLGGFISGRGK